MAKVMQTIQKWETFFKTLKDEIIMQILTIYVVVISPGY